MANHEVRESGDIRKPESEEKQKEEASGRKRGWPSI